MKYERRLSHGRSLHHWWWSIELVALAACGGANPVAPRATVSFVLDAPVCSSILPVQFWIDRVQVGTDTFVVGIAGREHTRSRAFSTSIGQHVLGARLLSGLVWPDTTVTLVPGQSFADSLPLYCS